MRPDAVPRRIRETAQSGPLNGPRLVVSPRAKTAAVIPHPERSMLSGLGAAMGAQLHHSPRDRPVNMVVKPLPEFHNHVCLRLVRRSDLVCVTATQSSGARRSCNSGAPICIDLTPELQLPREATGNPFGPFPGRSGYPARTLGRRLAALVNSFASPAPSARPRPRRPQRSSPGAARAGPACAGLRRLALRRRVRRVRACIRRAAASPH